MKYYSCFKTEHIKYKYIVIATSYISPLTVLDDVIKDLGISDGHIIFDLTIINGTDYNRYISATIETGKFIKSSFKTIYPLPAELSKISHQFFTNNPDIVGDSILSQSLKYLIKDGIV